MNRRGFLGTLFGLVAAPAIVAKTLAAVSTKSVRRSYPVTSGSIKLKEGWTIEPHRDVGPYSRK